MRFVLGSVAAVHPAGNTGVTIIALGVAVAVTVAVAGGAVGVTATVGDTAAGVGVAVGLVGIIVAADTTDTIGCSLVTTVTTGRSLV